MANDVGQLLKGSMITILGIFSKFCHEIFLRLSRRHGVGCAKCWRLFLVFRPRRYGLSS